MTLPSYVIKLPNAKMEVWRNNVRSTLIDGSECPAAPNGNDTMIDTLAHEMAHHLAAQFLGTPQSLCLSEGGASREWTDAKRTEERWALHLGPQIAEGMRAAQRLPLDKRNHSQRKLTPEDVRAIRREYGPKMGVHRLAAKYGLSKTAVHRVVIGASYKEIT